VFGALAGGKKATYYGKISGFVFVKPPLATLAT